MIRRIFALALLMSIGASAFGDTTAGVAAYERGDYEMALALLKPEAEKGDAVAQVKYGLIFAKGLGVPRNPAEAVGWFRKSAEQGNAEAQYALGVAYDIGDAGAVDRSQAAAWYRKSADQGYMRAQYNLGHLLLSEGDESQHEEGAALALKAAEQGMADAMYLYGNCCGAGRGVEQNLLCARYWLTEALAKGASDAKANLSRLESAIREIEGLGAPRTSGGDGSSMERAIILPDAGSDHEGVKAERAVAAYYFKEWRWGNQSLLHGPDGRVFDMIELTRGAATKPIYFDISNWFGKLE